MTKKQITQKEASEKYGVNTRGVNSLYKYFLLENGDVIDSDGDIRFINGLTIIKR